MASLKFRHYATESALKGTNKTVQDALNAFDVGTIVFIDETQKQYIITSKTNNVVTYKIYYGEPAVVSVSGSGAARTLTWSDGREETVTINDVDHATSADVSDTTKSVAWANVTGKPNIVTTDTEQTISGAKIFNNNTTFHNETDMESLTTDSLLVTGSARFTNTINGNLKGNVTGNVTGNLSGNASSATKAINDGNGNTITSTYATKTERANNDITAASLNATKLTLTRAAGNITANIPTWNQDTTGTAAKATADAKGNNIVNTYATKAEVAALPKSMVIKGTLDASHTLPTSGMTEGDTYIVGAKGTYNSIVCKVGDFFVRTSNSWLRIPAGDEWEYNENTIKAIKVNNAGHADTAGTATSAGTAMSLDSNPSGTFTAATASADASLTITAGGKTSSNITIGKVKAAFTADSATTASSCSGNSATATKAVTATSLGSGALTHMCSLHAMDRYNAYKIVTDWNKSDNIMPTINIRGYAYMTSGTIDCDIVIYHFNNASCNYSITNKGSYPIRVWQNIENDVQVFYISPGEYYGMFNVFVYSGARTNLLTKWSMTPVSEVSGTEIGCKPIATSITGNAATATIASSCSGNAGTATKLETARTLWGQSFDGSGNVSGSLKDVTTLTASGDITGRNIKSNGVIFSNNYNAAGNTAVAGFVFNKGGDYFGIGPSSGYVSNVGFGTTTGIDGIWKSELMTITNSGNVGIGTTSPTSKLHVAGTGYFTRDVSSAANIIAGGYIKGETVKISSGCTLEYDSTQKCVKFVFS